MKLRLPVVALFSGVALTLLACGDDTQQQDVDAGVDCSLEDRADPYMAGMTETGTTGLQVVLVESDPGPPRRGDNVWTIEVLDETEQPMNGLTITMDSNVDIFMPDHGHGTSKQPTITAADADGTYTIDPVNLWMPGYWEVTPHISDGADLEDEVTFKLCIDD